MSGEDRKSRQGGFTLLEAMVAFVVAALAMSALVEGVTAGFRASDTASRYQEATARARSRLAALEGTVPAPSQRGGADGGGYYWRERIQPLAATRTAGATGAPLPITLYAITVTVGWRDGAVGDGRAREVRLETRRLGPPPEGAP